MTTRSKQSAGLVMFRRDRENLEVFLVHPGGPFFAKKDQGAWTLPKGEYTDGEEPLAAAQREFLEETGFTASGPFLELGSIRQKSGKIIVGWAFEGDCDPSALVSNTCEVEWPPRSSRHILISEVDRGGWFTLAGAAPYLRAEQHPFLHRLEQRLRGKRHSISFAGSIVRSAARRIKIHFLPDR